MDKFEELEDRVTALERKRVSEVVRVDNVTDTAINFMSSSYYIDLEVSVMSASLAHIEVILNGITTSYEGNFVAEHIRTLRDNNLIIRVYAEGLLSKKIKISGIGVKLST